MEKSSIYEQLLKQTQLRPHATAILAPQRLPLTYEHLSNQADAVMQILNSMGIGRNDRVIIALENGPEMAVAFLTVAACATCIPVNPDYRFEELESYIARLDAKALIVDSSKNLSAEAVARTLGLRIVQLIPDKDSAAGIFNLSSDCDARPKRSGFAKSDELAVLLHTSGTTSRPKIVPITHHRICSMARNNIKFLELTEQDVCLNIMPLYHSTGLIGVTLSSIMSGGTVVCSPGFVAPKFFDWLKEFRPTWYTGVPSMHQAVLTRASRNDEIVAKHRFRFIRSSSSALHADLITQLEETFQAPVIESYGLTECGMIACNPLPPAQRRRRSVGLSTLVDLVIVDQRGDALGPGQIGEIVVHGDCVIDGYIDSVENEDCFKSSWFRTGDLGYLDRDGYLFLTGRLKEIINRAGEKISPSEVDAALMEHPSIEQAATFPVPSDSVGEEIAAAVVLNPSSQLTDRQIREFVATRLADFKVPRQILIVADIPKGPFGKIQRSQLSKLLGVNAIDRPSGEPLEFSPANSREELILTDIWKSVLGLDRVSIHDDFFRLGGDSILATQAISQINNTMHIELSPISLFETPTIAALAQSIQMMLQRAPETSKPAIRALPRISE